MKWLGLKKKDEAELTEEDFLEVAELVAKEEEEQKQVPSVRGPRSSAHDGVDG